MAVGVYGIQMQPTVIDLHLQEVIEAAAIGSEPVAARRVQRSPTATCDDINHASILGSSASVIEDRAGPFIVVIVPVKDDIHTIGFKDRHQVGLHPTRAAVGAGAVGWMMEENKLPRLRAGLQVVHQPVVLGAAGAVTLVCIQRYKMGVPPVEGIVLLFVARRRILRQVVDISVALVSTATAVQLVVPYTGIEGDIAHTLLVDVEIGPDVLVPRAIATRADATTVDDVTSMESQVKAVLIHLGRHFQSSLAWWRTGTVGSAITQGDESEPECCGFGRCGEGDLRPGCHVVAIGVYPVIVGSIRRQAGDGSRVPVLAVVGAVDGSHYVAVALVEAVADLTGPGAVCGPGDDHRSGGGFTEIWVDQQAGRGQSRSWCAGRCVRRSRCVRRQWRGRAGRCARRRPTPINGLVLIEKDPVVAPADGEDVQIPVAINVHHLRTVVMFVTRPDHMLRPTATLAIFVFKDVQPGARRVRGVMLADDHIPVAIAVHIGHVQAHRPNHIGDHVLRPLRGRHTPLLIPGQFPRLADGLKTDHRVQPPVSIHVGQTVPVGVPAGAVEGMRTPR